MSHRCNENLLHPLCLCRANPLPPPPPPLDEFGTIWAGVTSGLDTFASGVSLGQPTGYYRRVAAASAFPSSMIEGTVETFYCPGEHDVGAAQCSQHCTGEIGFRARGFTIEGVTYAPSPPPPAPPRHRRRHHHPSRAPASSTGPTTSARRWAPTAGL